jgi:hypothetical protein
MLKKLAFFASLVRILFFFHFNPCFMRFLHFDSELCLDRREIHPRKKKQKRKSDELV